MLDYTEIVLAKALLEGHFDALSAFQDKLPVFLEATDPYKELDYPFPKKKPSGGIELGKGLYFGPTKNGVPHGKGEWRCETYISHYDPFAGSMDIWSAGSSYFGEFVEGKREGYGVFEEKNNGIRTHYEGGWKDDKYDGEGYLRITRREGSLQYNTSYRGQFKAGKKSGEGAEFRAEWSSQRGHDYRVYIGEFKDGEPDGQGVRYTQEYHGVDPTGTIIREAGVFTRGRPRGEIVQERSDESAPETKVVVNHARGVPGARYANIKGLPFKTYWPEYGMPKFEDIELAVPSKNPILVVETKWCHDLMGPSCYFLGITEAFLGSIPERDMRFAGRKEYYDISLEVVDVADDSVTYEIPKQFGGGEATVHRGETNKHGHSSSHTATVYGDEYDYEVYDWISIRCL